MDIYEIALAPLEKGGLRQQRHHLIGQAYGRVLEIGAGNGANLTAYQFEQISQLILTDLDVAPLKRRAQTYPDIEVIIANGEALPFADGVFDCVVVTLVFCTLNVKQALLEVKRVLKTEGRLFYIEHVISPTPGVKQVMNWINPAWHRLAHGCNINRDFIAELLQAGFILQDQVSFFKQLFISGVAVKPLT